MLNRFEIYGIAALVTLLAAFGWGLYQKHEGRVEGRAEVQVKFDAFVNDTKAAGLKAEQDKLAKEKQDNEKITAAVVDRNTALARLQLAQAAASSRRSVLPDRTAGSGGSDKICFQRAALDQALQRFIGATAGIAQEGDVAIIDSLTLLRAWPSQVK